MSESFRWLWVFSLVGLILAVVTGQAVGQVEVTKLTAFDGSAGDGFAASSNVAVRGNIAIVGAWHDDDGGSDSGAAYVFTRDLGGPDNWGLVTKLTAFDATAGDWFGRRVALSGDIAIVGADEDDDAGSNSGSAYVFERNLGGPDNWGLVTKLRAFDGVAGDLFGISVAVSGDIVIVGANHDDDGGSDTGSAYVFARNQGGPDNWGLVTKLTAFDAAAGDWFGFPATIEGDIALLGATRDESGAGSVYVFDRHLGGPDNWGLVTKLTAFDAAAGDDFGCGIAISGDRLVVGADDDDDTASNSGSAYVFERNQGGPDSWGFVVKLIASDAAAFDRFGRQVGLSGDIVVVAAPLDDHDAGTNAGSAYMFARNEGGMDNWGEVAKLTASDTAEQDGFGASLAASGDVFIVGASGDDDACPADPGCNSGSAYVFQISPTCVWDCGDGDGNVGIVDFLGLLAGWGQPGTCDFGGGGVGIKDFLELLANWGPCP